MRRKWTRAAMAAIASAAIVVSACSAGASTQTDGQTTSENPAPQSGGDGSAGGAPTDGPASPADSVPASDSAPSGDSAPAHPPTDQTVRLGLVLEPESLDFTTVSGAAIPQVLLDNVYETLVVQKQDGSLGPGLAKSWDLSDDGTVYDFHLRDDATFSDGEPFTAADAAFSINYVQTKWTVNVAQAMDVVKSAEAVSDHELKVTLKNRDNLWLFKMTTRIGAMMSPKHVDKLGTEAIGTGPYVLEDWKHGTSITLQRNPNYWGTPPAIKTVVFDYFTDPSAMNNALLTGQIQAITTVQTPEALSQFKGSGKYTIIDGTTNGKVMMGINNAKAPLDDIRVRRAINYALDKPALLKAAWGGYGEVIGSHEVPTDPWFVNLADRYPHDVAKAKQLLKDAGHQDLTLTLKVASTLPYAIAAAPIIKSQLKQAGITVNVKTISWSNWLDKVYGDHDYELTIVNHVEQYDVTTVFDGKPDYYTQYTNPKVTKLEQQGLTADHDTFIKDFQDVVTTLADDAAAAWLWAFPNLMVADKDLHGLPENLIGESLKVFHLYTD